MVTYKIIREGDRVYIEIDVPGTVPGRYGPFKDEAEAERWAAERQSEPPAPPYRDRYLVATKRLKCPRDPGSAT